MGLPWTSHCAGNSPHFLDDTGSITPTQADTEVDSSQEDSYPLPTASPVPLWADKWAIEIDDEFQAPMPQWAFDWAEELKAGHSRPEPLPDSSTSAPSPLSRKLSQPPTKKLKSETRSMDLRVMMGRLSKVNEEPSFSMGHRCLMTLVAAHQCPSGLRLTRLKLKMLSKPLRPLPMASLRQEQRNPSSSHVSTPWPMVWKWLADWSISSARTSLPLLLSFCLRQANGSRQRLKSM